MATRVYVISTKNEGVIYTASNIKMTLAICENILTDKDFKNVKWTRNGFIDGMAEYKGKIVRYKRFFVYV